MRAVLRHRYGGPETLEVGEAPEPELRKNETLVRVHAAAVNPADWHYTTGRPYVVRLDSGIFGPRRPLIGVDVAGVVEVVADGVDSVRVGDRVFGLVPPGSFAESVRAPAKRLCVMPDGVSFEDASCLPCAGVTALQGLRDHGKLEAGQRALINGASGGVGTFAVQIAKSMGAEVVGVCSGRNVELVRSLGADRVIDYTREEVAGEGETYDVILDMVGSLSINQSKRLLRRGGRYVWVGGPMGDWIGPFAHIAKLGLASLRGGRTMKPMIAKPTRDDLRRLVEMIESGEVRAVISERYGLEGVPGALEVQREGHVRGKAVVVLNCGNS